MIHADTSSTCFGSVNNLLVENERRGGGDTTQFISFYQHVLDISTFGRYVNQKWKRPVKADIVHHFCALVHFYTNHI